MTTQPDNDPLSTVVEAQHAGRPAGLYAVCSANWFVLEASLRHAQQGEWPLLVESTCNQVNQDGGYTGLTPTQFMERLQALAREVGFPQERLVVGGDHLGPSPWQDEPAAVAMAKARTLVEAYVRAGYQKIHLDASMKLGDDGADGPLPREVAAGRAAELALVAEAAYRARGRGKLLRYVIGTEVPVPGGAQEEEEALAVSDPQGVAATIEATRAAFAQRDLLDAWQRVIAVVVQPGVEFGATRATGVRRALHRLPGGARLAPVGRRSFCHSESWASADLCFPGSGLRAGDGGAGIGCRRSGKHALSSPQDPRKRDGGRAGQLAGIL